MPPDFCFASSEIFLHLSNDLRLFSLQELFIQLFFGPADLGCCIIWNLFCIMCGMSVKPGWKSNSNVAYCCKYHVVWCTKYRRKVLSDQVAVRLKEIVNDVAKEVGVEVLDIEVTPDHVHLLCEVDPQFGIAKFVRMVKGRTSHHLRLEFPALRSRLPTLWTNSWFVATVGGTSLAIIERYIKEQKKFTRNSTTASHGG